VNTGNVVEVETGHAPSLQEGTVVPGFWILDKILNLVRVR
jgi:hypothetical protein